MIEWLTSDPVRAMMVAVISVIGGSYLPWKNILKTILPGKGTTVPVPTTDGHIALSKLVDVIHVVRAHGDIPTADALGALLPAVLTACCATHHEDIDAA